MRLQKNRAIIACAGSGKTSHLVERALALDGQPILITTYTRENVQQIRDCFIRRVGCLPPHVTVLTWFAFLLQDGVRPYHNRLANQRVRSIHFLPAARPYHRKAAYLTAAGDVYSHKVAEFAYECNRATDGLVLRRLERVYSHIFIDELQDLAGYDLTLLEEVFRSSTAVTLVGDPRQATFSTNNAAKNRQYRRAGMLDWLKARQLAGQIVLEEYVDCHRSNQAICDFADALYPDFPKTRSLNGTRTNHDGVFAVSPAEVASYVATHKPVILRYMKTTDTHGLPAMNIGLSKGRTFDRVLIFPTTPMTTYLQSRDVSLLRDRAKLYIGVTRARFSVGFVVPAQNASAEGIRAIL